MKKSKIVFTVIAFLRITSSFCQNEDMSSNEKPLKRKLKVVDASILPGAVFQRDPIGSLKDFQKINPQSTLLKENMEGYSPRGTGIIGSLVGITFNANLGFSFADKEQTNNKLAKQIRIGVSFSGIGMSNYLSKIYKKQDTTFTSSQTGQTVFADTINDRSYAMDYKSQQIRIDLSVIYKTNPAARWSVYGGIGVEAGKSINAYTDIEYNEYIISSGYSSYSYRSERILSKNSYGYAAYLPLGIDFRVGTRREFFKRLHLFYEVRPILNYTYIPKTGSVGGVGVKNGMGLRVTI